MSFSEEVRAGLPDQVLKVAALSAVIGFFDGQYKQARKDAEVAFRSSRIKKIGIVLPGGREEIGEITVVQPAPALTDLDETALLAHVERFNPSEVEEYLDPLALIDEEIIEYCREHRDDLLKRRVRPVWRAELKRQIVAADGNAVDKETGEATKVGIVERAAPTGQFALSKDPYGVRADRLMTELLAGHLGQLVQMPSLETAADAEKPAELPAEGGYASGGLSGGGYSDGGFSGYAGGGYSDGAP